MTTVAISAADLNNLFPVVVPIAYLSDDWGGPIKQVSNVQVAMTWAIQGADNRRHYVTDGQAAEWLALGIDWEAIAARNAIILSAAGGFGQKNDADGRPFIKAMLTDDGLGPTRLFTPRLFDKELGSDYEVAVPEFTCAIAFRRNLTPEQEADVAGIIGGCFASGTTPVSDNRFPASAFWTTV